MACSEELRRAGLAYPRTCTNCGLGPCKSPNAIQMAFTKPHGGGPFTGLIRSENEERITRDEWLIGVARLTAWRSTCCRRFVGAVIASHGRIVSSGYNGAPGGLPHCTPGTCNAERPCTSTIHAEANAIAFAAREGVPTEGATLYATASPCLDCAKLLINAGIKRVVYHEEYRKTEGIDLLRSVGIAVEHWQGR